MAQTPRPNGGTGGPPATPPLGRLRQLATRRPIVERCDLCGRNLASDHDHLLEPLARRLTCVCGPCAVLFSGPTDARFRRVPRRVRALTAFRMTDAQWDALRLPINLAFFFRSSVQERIVACYPSPAGATESMLPLETWEDIARENPALADMETDVEALLVNRVARGHADAPPRYFLVPIDRCYALVGLIRSRWTGFSGGTEVWREIADFFEALERRATPVGEPSRA